MASKTSGGILTYNFREGFRSESLAQYVFSAFGPCIPLLREDFGIDLFCNVAERVGTMLQVKASYGVQVKSEGEPIVFSGKQALKWCAELEYPLLLAIVNKHESKISIYSTWNLNHLLLFIDAANEDTIPDKIEFLLDQPIGELRKENNKYTGDVEVGQPILRFNIMELGEPEIREYYWNVLREWIEFDVDNYKRRRAGIPIVFGYNNWETNKDKSNLRGYQKFYFFNPHTIPKAEEVFVQSATVIAEYIKSNTVNADQFNKLRALIVTYYKHNMDDFMQTFNHEMQ